MFGKDGIISTPDSKVKVVVLPTDEELMIAQDTMALVK
jgi:acetate kinase